MFDFSALRVSPGGSLSQPDYTTANGEVKVEAFFYQSGPNAYIQGPVMIGTSLVEARLFLRNDGGAALGLGVCPPYESTAGACIADHYSGGGGEINELDNAGAPEMIRLTLGEHYRQDAVWVASLTGSERGQLRYSNDGTLSGLLLGGSFTSYVQLDPASATQRIALHGAAASARYLYLLPGPTTTTCCGKSRLRACRSHLPWPCSGLDSFRWCGPSAAVRPPGAARGRRLNRGT